jgi:nucleoside-diphosphate-sugar epimerase
MKILLTGASGFVGGHLAPRLVEAGHSLVCGVRGSSGYEPPPGARRIELDLARPLETATLPEADAVVHLAQANVRFPEGAQELYSVNTASTLELLEHARRTGAQRFVYASSASVYGFGDRPFVEDDALAGRDFYGATKIGAEALVRAYGGLLTTAVLRLVVPYGPGQQARMIPGLIGRVRAGTPVTLNAGGRPRMNPLYIDDVVRAVLGVLELEDAAVLNVAGDEPVTVRELAEQIGAVVGREPIFEDGEGDVPGDIVADTSRLHELLDIRPLVPLAEGLRRTAEASVATVPTG